jgi:hypothetical protein
MRKIIIYCDGGLGNRLNGLYGGLALAEVLKITPEIYWPRNRMCMASLEDIFDTIISCKNFGLDQIKVNFPDSELTLVSHDSRKFKFKKFIDINNFLSINELIKCIDKSNGIVFVYSNSQIPPFMFWAAVTAGRNFIKFKQETIRDADDILKKLTLHGRKYIALHLRGTDYGFPKCYFFFWKFLAKITPFNILLCSDDDEVRMLFSDLKNVKIPFARVLPEKLKTVESWNYPTIDEYGRNFEYNIIRNEESILHAVTEMYLLVLGIKIYTSRSTFLSQSFIIRPGISSFVIFFIEGSYHFIRYLKRLLIDLRRT